MHLLDQIMLRSEWFSSNYTKANIYFCTYTEMCTLNRDIQFDTVHINANITWQLLLIYITATERYLTWRYICICAIISKSGLSFQ